MAETSGSEPKRIKLDHGEEEGWTSDLGNNDCPPTLPAKSKTLSDSAPQVNFKDLNHEIPDAEVEKPVSEIDVGITEYISQHNGFQGIIKQRYSDFLVNEIDLSGQKVSLTDISEPEPDDYKQDEVEVENILTAEQLASLAELASSSELNHEVSIPVGEDKQERSLIHGAIRKEFPELGSSTNTVDGVRTILVSKSKESEKRGRGNGPQKRKFPWSRPGTDYCHFCLYKENMDTMQAVNILSRYLGVKPNMLTYSGTKDRRAKTCQRMSVYRISAAKLHSVNSRLNGMAIGNFRYCKEPLGLGDLKGNHFTIILRNVTGSPNHISQAMSSLKSVGFINYFGMQRFGTSSVPTHLVGKALLKSNWQEAIELILKPRSGSNQKVFSARISWWKHRDAAKALELIRNEHCPERHLLNGLKTRPETDLVGALSFIPRNQRTMYVHAYQSYIWNKVVSRRFTKYGVNVLIGDLLIKSGSCVVDYGEGEGCEKKQFVQPAYVTAENLDTHTIHDVVMPLPGYDVLYPQNDSGEWYIDMLKEDGLTPKDLQHKVKDYSLRGQYRHILVKPTEVSWETLAYDNDFHSLVLSDLDKLKNVQLPETKPDACNTALKIELSLPSSTYATMALREVLKQDTSAAYQSKLTAENQTQTSAGPSGGEEEEETSQDMPRTDS